MKIIYVQIPAYRDTELGPTLLDMFEKAAHPDQIRVRVCWQHAPQETLPKAVLDHHSIEIVDVPFECSGGCNWARKSLQDHWNNEKYTLLLDSHHRFIAGWDAHLITMYESLKSKGIEKPLITAYLPPYEPNNDPQGREMEPLEIRSLSRERGLLIYLSSYRIPLWTWLTEPIKAKFVSLHFIFTLGIFNHEIIFDEDIYFFGDEVVTALKAFTHGYDLFHPHYVLGWHLYYRDKTRITHWSDHSDFETRHEKSHERMRDIFLGLDDRGLGTVKTLAQYENLINDKLLTC